MLKFSFGNMKLNEVAKILHMTKKEIVSFDLPAGWTCPKANICKTFVGEHTGKMRKVGKIMCYASKAECYAPSARKLRWSNFHLLHENCKSVKSMVSLISEALPKQAKIVRLHSSGDFFTKNYFIAWMEIAKLHPEILFYGYSKILDYTLVELPDNMFLQYSFGSKDDERMLSLTDKPATCFIGEYEGQYPEYKTLCKNKIDAHEDMLAIISGENFVLSIH